MGHPKNGSRRTISQEAFEELVKENMEDLGMDPSEALDDAIHTLSLQEVDLSGIVTCIPGVTSVKDIPVIQSLDRLRDMEATLLSCNVQDNDELGGITLSKQTMDFEGMVEQLDKLYDLCTIDRSGNASIATRNGGVELLTSICSTLDVCNEQPLVSALRTLGSFLHDLQCTETFGQSDDPMIVVNVLNSCNQNVNILKSGFTVVAAALTGNEVLKELFMELKIDELLLQGFWICLKIC